MVRLLSTVLNVQCSIIKTMQLKYKTKGGQRSGQSNLKLVSVLGLVLQD